MGGWDRWGVVDSHQGVAGGTGGRFYLIVFSLFVLLSFGVSCRVSFLIEYSMIAIVSVFLFLIRFVCLRSL